MPGVRVLRGELRWKVEERGVRSVQIDGQVIR